MDQNKIDPFVVFTANGLLFILSVLSLAMHIKPVDKKNPHAAVRGVMAATLLKLMVLGISAMVYLFAAGENRSIKAIFAGMILYVVYTFIEVSIASKHNQNNNAGK
ncbi:MAG TPA: 7 transmembrane receptor [Chitinophagaceae bacterium]|nr:7 transmembrane receptor [Chitinophagaceae bacterium]